MTPAVDRTALAKALRAFFAEHLPHTRGLSPHTVRSYRDAFVLLLRFLSARHTRPVVSLDLGHLGSADLLAFLDDLETTRHNRVCTRNSRLAAVHTFARFVATRNPEQMEACQRLLAVPTKRATVQVVEYLEANEIRAILAAVGQSPDRVRDRALLLALFNTGARVQEILDVQPRDLRLERPCSVRLRGKGRKERVCPLWLDTVQALQDLLATRPASLAATATVFRNHRGEGLTRFGVRYLVRRYAARGAAIAPGLASKRVHPHTYRHSAAVHLLHAGVDLVTISQWLGHASIETTNRYAVVDLESKRRALERAGPITDTPAAVLSAWRADASVLTWLEAL